MPASGESLTFGLVHGSMHGAWCWDDVRTELDILGHESIAVDLPIEDPDANLDTYAYKTIAGELRHADKPVLVGASSGANTVIRVATFAEVKSLIYVCGSFYPSTMHAMNWTPEETERLPSKYQPGYEESIITLNNGLTTLTDENAEKFFFDDCSEQVAKNAVAKLRKQWRSRTNPPQQEWPAVPQHSIICRDDRVVNPEWSRAVANKLGVPITEFPGGHSPFLSRPNLLAKTLVKLAVT